MSVLLDRCFHIGTKNSHSFILILFSKKSQLNRFVNGQMARYSKSSKLEVTTLVELILGYIVFRLGKFSILLSYYTIVFTHPSHSCI